MCCAELARFTRTLNLNSICKQMLRRALYTFSNAASLRRLNFAAAHHFSILAILLAGIPQTVAGIRRLSPTSTRLERRNPSDVTAQCSKLLRRVRKEKGPPNTTFNRHLLQAYCQGSLPAGCTTPLPAARTCTPA